MSGDIALIILLTPLTLLLFRFVEIRNGAVTRIKDTDPAEGKSLNVSISNYI